MDKQVSGCGVFIVMACIVSVAAVWQYLVAALLVFGIARLIAYVAAAQSLAYLGSVT